MSSRPTPPVLPADPVATSIPVRRAGLFFLLATAVSVVLSLPVAAGLLPETALGLVVPLAQLSPLLAALLVRRRDEPWWRSLVLHVPSGKALLIAALAAVVAFTVVPLARMLLGVALGVDPLAGGPPLLGVLLAVPVVLVMQSVFAIGEEAAWRGWLHSALATLGFWRMSLVIGLMWALWHLPVVLALGLHGREMLSYLGTIVAVAPLLSALRHLSGTAWAAILGHGLLNSLRVALEQNVLGPVGPATLWVLDLGSWALWIAVAWMILRIGGGAAPADGAVPERGPQGEDAARSTDDVTGATAADGSDRERSRP